MKYSNVIICLAFSLPGLALADQFKRGDANMDNEINIADPVMTLAVLYMGADSPGCDDAMDIDDNGKLDTTDVINSLRYLFLGDFTPQPPFQDCGDDPRADSLGCTFFPPCIVCLSQEDLEAIIDENIVSSACLGADLAEVDLGVARVFVCPESSAGQCGDPEVPGCEILINSVTGELDIPARKITVTVEGAMPDLPIRIEPILGNPSVCENKDEDDITFKGDVVITFEVEPAGTEYLRITEIHDPTTENVVVTLRYEGGLLCNLLEANKDLLVENFIDQLQAQLGDLILQLKEEFVGSYLCK